MSIFVVATPFRHRGLDIFHIFPVTKALYLLRCRVVAVAKLSNCRVPSSVIFLIFPYRAWARTLFSRSGWPPSPAGGRTESSRQPTIGQRLSMQVFFWLTSPSKNFFVHFLASGGGSPLHAEIFTVLHNDLAAPRDHCGRCRIRTRDLCPRILARYQWATISPIPSLLGLLAKIKM